MSKSVITTVKMSRLEIVIQSTKILLGIIVLLILLTKIKVIEIC